MLKISINQEDSFVHKHVFLVDARIPALQMIYYAFISMACHRNLREMFKLDAADYMMSICGDDGLREISSPGKSGSIFYLSHDDRFVIKTLKRSELKV